MKINDICDYNPRRFMSNILKFDDIIMNIFRNKALECYMEVVGGYLTKTENKKIYMYIGSLEDFIGRKSSMEVLMLDRKQTCR